MTYSIAIPTVDRPYRSHLFHRLVETGTLTHPLVKGFHVAYDRDPNRNAEHALLAAVEDDTDYVIFLEDDIEIVNDFIGSVDRFIADVRRTEQGAHFYSLGCGAKRALRQARAAGDHWWRYPLKDYYGTCGLVFPTANAREFATLQHRQLDWMVSWNQMDVNLVRWQERTSPTRSWVPTPTTCLINHLGAQSSLSTDATHWTGQFDGFRDIMYEYPCVS